MVLAKAKSFVTRSAIESAPARKFRRQKIKDIVHSSRRILFVCSGNICRSPFAEYYAKTVLPKVIEVRSSGFHEVANRKSPNQAIESATEFGVDLSDHRSTTLDELLVSSADIIFIFEEKHRDSMVELFPDHIEKTYYLGDLKSHGSTEIADPYGGDKKRFSEAYHQIIDALDQLRLKQAQ